MDKIYYNPKNPYDVLYAKIRGDDIRARAIQDEELAVEFAHLITEAEMVYRHADVIAPV